MSSVAADNIAAPNNPYNADELVEIEVDDDGRPL